MKPDPLKSWREKLAFLYEQAAIVSDPSQKFQIAKDIETAKSFIAELEAEAKADVEPPAPPAPLPQVPVEEPPGAPSPAGDARGVRSLSIPVDGEEVTLYTSSHALIVGNGDYSAGGWPSLTGVPEDVVEVREALAAHGFSVEVREDLASDALAAAIRDFIDTHGNDPHCRLMVYYAGHGYTTELEWGGQMGYVVPVDAPSPRADRDGLLKKAVSMHQFEGWAYRIRCKHALFVFDSCFAGSIFDISRGTPEYISAKTARPVRQFITSGSAEEEVPDQSVFRRQLVAALRGEADIGKNGYITGAELGEFLFRTVVNYSRRRQHPQYGKIMHPKLDKGDFVFEMPSS